MRLQVNDIGRGTNISVHVDSNFKVLLLFMNSKHLSVKLSPKTRTDLKRFLNIFKKTVIQEVKILKGRFDDTCTCSKY